MLKKATSEPAQRSRNSRGTRQAAALTPGQHFQHLKTAMRRRLVTALGGDIPLVLIRRALDEAEEAAVGTGFPHLFFPELAAEQVRRVSAAIRPELHHYQVRSLTDAYAA